jgi:hypothetical protein
VDRREIAFGSMQIFIGISLIVGVPDAGARPTLTVFFPGTLPPCNVATLTLQVVPGLGLARELFGPAAHPYAKVGDLSTGGLATADLDADVLL